MENATQDNFKYKCFLLSIILSSLFFPFLSTVLQNQVGWSAVFGVEGSEKERKLPTDWSVACNKCTAVPYVHTLPPLATDRCNSLSFSFLLSEAQTDTLVFQLTSSPSRSVVSYEPQKSITCTCMQVRWRRCAVVLSELTGSEIFFPNCWCEENVQTRSKTFRKHQLERIHNVQ